MASAAPYYITDVKTVPETMAIGSYVFSYEVNPVQIGIYNDGDYISNVKVDLYASDVSSGPVATTNIDFNEDNENWPAVTLADPTLRSSEGGTVTYTAVVAPGTEYESSGNSADELVKYNGYKGKRYWTNGSDITTRHTYDIQGNILYSTQPESYYRNRGWGTRTENWVSSDLPIPSGSTIKEAWLYIGYNWDTTPGGSPNWSSVRFNGNQLTGGVQYTDKKNFGSYSYIYGLYAYNVTSQFNSSGNSLFMQEGSGNSNALYPSTLVVVYTNANETRKQIFINEECDELLPEYGFGVTPEEATAYAPFTGISIDKNNVTKATLHSFAGSAGPNEGNLLFNGKTVATGAWQGTANTANASVFNVMNYINSTGNEAGIQGTSTGGMDALQNILVVEYQNQTTAPVADFSAAPTSGTAPLTVQFTDASTGTVSSYAWDFNNDGVVDSTEQSPIYTYSTTGNYTVNLTVNNAGGSDSEVKPEYIVVGEPLPEAPVANFNVVLDEYGQMPHGLAPITVSFTDASTGTNDTYLWEYRIDESGTWTPFGSGAQNPTDIEFSDVGTYDIRLTVTNSAGSSNKTITHAFTAGGLHDYLTTITNGTVSGDLYVNSQSPWADTAHTYSYTLPASGSNITWARVFVNVYSGSGANNFPVRITTELDSTGTGSWSTLGVENGDIQSESSSTPYAYPVNDHMTKVYSDYEVWYDVTSLLTSTTPQIRVTCSDIESPVGPDGGYDGRIKAITLVVAYNNDSTQQVKYIVNHGNDWMTGSSSTTFDTSSFTSGLTNATIKDVALSSTDAIYTLNSGSVTKTSLGTNSYWKYNSFNVTSVLNSGASNTFGFTNNGASFKICLATLTASYPGTTPFPAPVAGFTADPTSGTAPLTVQFTDASAGNVTSWDWDFGDNSTASEQNPSHTYATAGNYTVNLTVSNAGGNDSEVKTDFINVSSGSVPPTNDLSIGFVVSSSNSAVFAKETNTINVNGVTNSGTENLTNIPVALYASDVSGGTVPVGTTTIASLASGESKTVSIIDFTIRNLEGGTITYTAVVDPDNLIDETDETNNNKSSAGIPLKYNGYKGKRYWEAGSDITTKHVYDFNGNVSSYTQPAASYRSVGWTSRTETWNSTSVPIPALPSGSTIEQVLLYVSYNWDQTPGGYPWWRATLNDQIIDNGNISLGNGTLYTDISNFGGYANYEYGLVVYNVTDKYNQTGINRLRMYPYNNESQYNKVALYPSTLVLIYRNSNETRKQIFINEECDELGVSDMYGTNLSEATAYAPFTGMTIDVSKVGNATLYSFAGSAGESAGEGNLLFNGNIVATGAWQGNANTANASVFDVKNYINATGNEAGIQGTASGGMDALQQILVVEYQAEQEPAPVANFTADPTSGTIPLSVLFTDTSTGNVNSWLWDFGDGTNSTGQNVSHTYASAGLYTVNLTVTGPGGSESEVKTGYINVSTPIPAKPVAAFSASPTLGIMPLNVQFTDQSTGVPTNYTWTFGDGSTSYEQNPSHVYSKVGRFTVKLTAKNAKGTNSTTKTNYIVVEVVPATEFSANRTVGKLPMAVKFTDKSTGAPTSWNWDFGDGNTSTEKSPTNVYGAVGKYNVTLTATNAVGNNTITKYSYIDVEVVPLANFSADPTVGIMPLSVSFTDLSTGVPTNYTWTFGDGNISYEKNPSHVYSKVGQYTVKLTVKNAVGSNSTTKTKYIDVEIVPIANFTANKTVGKLPMAVKFTDKSTGTPTSWYWDFGDGNTSTEKSPKNVYGAVGKYNVTLTATNAAGNNTYTRNSYIDVEEVPVANFSADSTVGAVPFNVSFTDLSTGVPTNWTWTFGDGNSSYEQNPSHIYSKGGQYSVKLTAKNAVGSNSTTLTKYITVESVPAASFTASPTSGAHPLSVTFTDKSTGFPESWNWSFGDGNTSTEKNPVNVYSAVGQYNVSLTVTNLAGTNTKSMVKYIKVS